MVVFGFGILGVTARAFNLMLLINRKRVALLGLFAATSAIALTASLVGLRAEQSAISERKSLEDQLPMTLEGVNYIAQKAEIPGAGVAQEEAVSAVIDAFMADNPQLSSIDEVREILGRENRAQTVLATGRSLTSSGEYRDYSSRPVWMVELTSVPVGGGSCGALPADQCPPTGRAPYFKALVDADTGAVIETMYQGLGPADPVWDDVNRTAREAREQERQKVREAIERGELEPPPTATPAPSQ